MDKKMWLEKKNYTKGNLIFQQKLITIIYFGGGLLVYEPPPLQNFKVYLTLQIKPLHLL